MTVKTYNELKTEARTDEITEKLLGVYFSGLQQGIEWMNTEAEAEFGAIYCPPSKMAMTVDQFRSIVDGFVENPMFKKLGKNSLN